MLRLIFFKKMRISARFGRNLSTIERRFLILAEMREKYKNILAIV